jgi:hypothetical protein
MENEEVKRLPPQLKGCERGGNELTLRIQLINLYQLKNSVRLFQPFSITVLNFVKREKNSPPFDVVHHYENGLTVF